MERHLNSLLTLFVTFVRKVLIQTYFYKHIVKNFIVKLMGLLHAKLAKKGGFQSLDLIIAELKSHMTCSKFKVSHWWKFYLSKKNPLQDLLSSLNAVISTNERHWIITGHVTF